MGILDNVDFSDGSAKLFKILEDLIGPGDSKRKTRLEIEQIRIHCQVAYLSALKNHTDPMEALVKTLECYNDLKISLQGSSRSETIEGLKGLMFYDKETSKRVMTENADRS